VAQLAVTDEVFPFFYLQVLFVWQRKGASQKSEIPFLFNLNAFL